MSLLYLVLGTVGLLAGAEMAVRGSMSLSERLGWPAWLAGVLFLALGTSLPEFFVGWAAAPAHPTLALGNVFGSNAFNVALVLGFLALLSGRGGLPVGGIHWKVALPLFAGSLAAYPAFAAGAVPGWVGPLFLVLYGATLFATLKGRGAEPLALGEEELLSGEVPLPARTPWPLQATLMLAGFVLLALASDLFLDGALGVADWFGWKEGFAGYLVAAVGTSAPELFTSLRVLKRHHASAVIGNILGSNAFNLLLVGGIIPLRAGVPIDAAYLQPQIAVNFAATLVVTIPSLLALRRLASGRTRRPLVLGPRTGLLLVLAYLAASWWVVGGK